MKFVFQGSQKLHIRVAISFEALIGFQCIICQIIVHFMPHWPVYSDLMGTFPTPSSSLCTALQNIKSKKCSIFVNIGRRGLEMPLNNFIF